MSLPREAVHDADGFLKDPRRPYNDTYSCTAGACKRTATVLDEVFLCDEHWLRCDTCGTGYFLGITHIYCPRCHAAHFKEIER